MGTDDVTAPAVSPCPAAAVASVAALAAGQVVGQGWVMVRDWPGAEITGGVGRYSVAMVIISVAVVVLAGTAAAAAAEVWPEPVGGWRAALPARPGYVALGVAVALGVPMAWGVEDGQGIFPAGPAVWLYALSWGAGLAAVGWLRGRAAVVAGVTVVLSAVVCAVFVVSIHVVAYYATPPVAD
ncbi:hypothetical protein [Actinoplanes sp. NPDC049599]|uniref:hypothetical protein n=1 Tax=Actinoplanes sp. NPDC049599 TaxID=3363903 RepID=UPI0037B0B1BE